MLVIISYVNHYGILLPPPHSSHLTVCIFYSFIFAINQPPTNIPGTRYIEPIHRIKTHFHFPWVSTDWLPLHFLIVKSIQEWNACNVCNSLPLVIQLSKKNIRFETVLYLLSFPQNVTHVTHDHIEALEHMYYPMTALSCWT